MFPYYIFWNFFVCILATLIFFGGLGYLLAPKTIERLNRFFAQSLYTLDELFKRWIVFSISVDDWTLQNRFGAGFFFILVSLSIFGLIIIKR